MVDLTTPDKIKSQIDNYNKATEARAKELLNFATKEVEKELSTVQKFYFPMAGWKGVNLLIVMIPYLRESDADKELFDCLGSLLVQQYKSVGWDEVSYELPSNIFGTYNKIRLSLYIKDDNANT